MSEPNTPGQAQSPENSQGSGSAGATPDCSGTPGGGAGFTDRQTLAYCQRVEAAKVQILKHPYDVPDSCPPPGCTPDEVHFPRYAASFHKLLAHDANGLLTTGVPDSGVDNYRRLLKGLKIDQPSSDFDHAALDGLTLLNRNVPAPFRPRVLINPQSSKSLSIKGPDIVSLDLGKIVYGAGYAGSLLAEISLGSDFSAAEIVELYGMALLRDLPFDEYESDTPFTADADLIVDALCQLGGSFVWGYPHHHKLTAAAGGLPVRRKNLFRGPTKGDQAGDYLSVFLTFDRPPLFPAGCAPHVADLIGAGQFAGVLGEPLLVPLGKPKDFALTLDHYVRIQNSDIPEPYPPRYFSGRGRIVNGRNLGDYVHVDNVYEEYIRAADILVGHQYPRTPLSPYVEDAGRQPYYKNESDGPTLGPADAYGLVGGVRIVAERAAFPQKYLVARRARPEVMAALVHLAKGGAANLEAHLSRRLFETSGAVHRLLERARSANRQREPQNPAYDTYLLPQMYPEGSPVHPSWPSGHATVAGACVTVLKAIFEDARRIIDPSSPAGAPQGYVAPDGSLPTVGDELDKLASNIAFGRNFAGVHYRSDGEHGILLGEEVAIRYLQDHLREYRETFRASECGAPSFTLTRRNGVRVCITPGAVTEVAAMAAKEAMIHPKSTL